VGQPAMMRPTGFTDARAGERTKRTKRVSERRIMVRVGTTKTALGEEGRDSGVGPRAVSLLGMKTTQVPHIIMENHMAHPGTSRSTPESPATSRLRPPSCRR
jgi:hypothetical protein